MNKETFENIKTYVDFLESATCKDIVENPQQYDDENIEFWYNQHCTVQEVLRVIAHNYGVDWKKIYKTSYIAEIPKKLIKELEKYFE